MSKVNIIPFPHEVNHCGYYVYAHKISGESEFFYIGKGKGKRAWSTHNRNKIWRDVAMTGQVTVEILQCNMSEDDALLLEEWLIAKLRSLKIPIANIASGGARGGGWKHKEETLKILREIKSGENNPRYGARHKAETKKIMSEIASGSGNPFYKKTHSDKTKKLISEKQSGSLNAFYNPKEYDFWHPTYGIVTCTQNHLRKAYKLKHSGVSTICSGKQLSHYGWRLLENKDASNARLRMPIAAVG